MKRILIVDDHPIMRRGLIQLLSLEPGLQIHGDVGTAADALAVCWRIPRTWSWRTSVCRTRTGWN